MASQVERYRNFAFLMYPDSMPDNAISSLIRSNFKVAVSPLHQPESDETKEHYHGVVLFDGPKKFDTINDYFKETYHTPRLEVIYDVGQAIRYLIHKGFDSKIQYPFETIRANFDLRKYFTEDVFIIDILQIIEREQYITSYTKLIWWLRDHGQFDFLEKVAKMSYFFGKYFDDGLDARFNRNERFEK